MTTDPAPRPPGRELRLLIAVTGVAGAVAFVIGAAWLHFAEIEPIDADGAAIAAAVSDHRTALLACYAWWNAAIMVQLVFLAGLSLVVFRRGHALPALTGALASAVLTVLMFVGFCFLGGLAFRAPHLSADTAQLLSDLFYLLLSLAGFPSAAVTIALSWPILRTRGWLPQAVGAVGVASAAVHLEAALALARSGAWSPAGWGGYAAPALFVAWMFGVAVLHLRDQGLSEQQRT